MEEIGVLKTFLSYAMWDDATYYMPGYVLCGGFFLVGWGFVYAFCCCCSHVVFLVKIVFLEYYILLSCRISLQLNVLTQG